LVLGIGIRKPGGQALILISGVSVLLLLKLECSRGLVQLTDGGFVLSAHLVEASNLGLFSSSKLLLLVPLLRKDQVD